MNLAQGANLSDTSRRFQPICVQFECLQMMCEQVSSRLASYILDRIVNYYKETIMTIIVIKGS